jgi:hypothetical protein
VTSHRVVVELDSDDLRMWADHHAGAGRHGVAHVLYKAAEEVERIAAGVPTPVDRVRAVLETFQRTTRVGGRRGGKTLAQDLWVEVARAIGEDVVKVSAEHPLGVPPKLPD